MTRLTEILMYRRPLKKFTNYRHVPLYKEILPAQLKNTVSAKGERGKVAPCLQEMSLMLACFKDHEFSEVLCSKEVQAFNKCNADFATAKKAQAHAEQSGVLSRSKGGRLNTKQLNELLQHYPQPK